jgi:Mn2+/Fe2+ NRAMP family transporter
MSVCIAAMFVIVLVNTIAMKPDWGAVAVGTVLPTIPKLDGEGLSWTFALIGGVGGTVTVLCYGYWIREENREGLGELKNCRIDLITAYVATAIFGLCMVILGSKLEVSGGGATLLVGLADQLRDALGDAGGVASIAFLLGAWGAVFSSMFGVWQSVPYLFADCLNLLKRKSGEDQTAQGEVQPKGTNSEVYNWSMILIATIPIVGLFTKFDRIQLAYALVGAAFMPLLAFVLIFLNGSAKRVGQDGVNTKRTTVALAIIIAMFISAGVFDVRKRMAKDEPQKQTAPEQPSKN